MSNKSENSREKFVRLANKRTNKVLESLRVLGNLSSRKRYDYESSDVKKIFKAIDDELKRIKALFETTSLQDFQLEV
jgi:hypothetical protein